MCSQKIRFRDAGETPTEEVEMAAPAKENSSPGSFNIILKIFRSTASLLIYPSIPHHRKSSSSTAAAAESKRAAFLPSDILLLLRLVIR
jgi:hypothetical protein